jgi:hypothetical protein
MKEPKKKRRYVTSILRELIVIDATDGDLVSETVEEVLA